MRQTNENTSVKLKLVMLFDWRKQIYCICSHNLTPEDASQQVTELRRDGLPAFTVDQRSRHLHDDAEECAACRADVQQCVNPTPALERRKLEFRR
ncbi:MAG: hypothetical protein DMG70_04515 [Acidobacteria bacterium]|nr:MAG: hypothetical protein DMG70_04515 [Acidobacteriota bacterium]PYY04008.1 MAG: hypothetical protein DMG69_31510 [Acidobacteriota bacterium]